MRQTSSPYCLLLGTSSSCSSLGTDGMETFYLVTASIYEKLSIADFKLIMGYAQVTREVVGLPRPVWPILEFQ